MNGGFRAFYREQSALFDRLASREDWQGRLFAALNEICRLDGLRIAEYGAGTGRLTRLLAAQAKLVYAFDIEPAMLALARENLQAAGMTNWRLGVADNLRMPLAANCVDLAVEGWSFAHSVAWHGEGWRQACDSLLNDMARVLRPGGTAILIETLGTGHRQPNPPGDWLPQLYQHWQDQHGFQRRWIRTDYQFASEAEMDELLRAFFGAALADQALAAGKLIVPECTGIWHKRVD